MRNGLSESDHISHKQCHSFGRFNGLLYILNVHPTTICKWKSQLCFTSVYFGDSTIFPVGFHILHFFLAIHYTYHFMCAIMNSFVNVFPSLWTSVLFDQVTMSIKIIQPQCIIISTDVVYVHIDTATIT